MKLRIDNRPALLCGVHFSAIGALFAAAWAQHPGTIGATFPGNVSLTVAALLVALGANLVGRAIRVGRHPPLPA